MFKSGLEGRGNGWVIDWGAGVHILNAAGGFGKLLYTTVRHVLH